MTDYLLIGNGVASVSAAESLRVHDEEGEIKIVSKEPHLAYSRPLISYLLGEKVTEDSMLYKGRGFYEENNIEVILGTEAEYIDPNRKYVVLEDGTELHYGKSLIATGGSPFLPEVEGKELDGVFTFTQWADVNEIREYIEEKEVEDVIIVGGGLIRMKAMGALMNFGVDVTVLELADKIMSATFDKKASDLIVNLIRESRFEIITENTVERIRGDEEVESVELMEGRIWIAI